MGGSIRAQRSGKGGFWFRWRRPSVADRKRRATSREVRFYNAILHDRSLPTAIEVTAVLGLTGLELNSGGFLPAVHIPTFDEILTSDTARDDFLGLFEGTGVGIAGLNCNGNRCTPTWPSARSTPRTFVAASDWPTGWASTGSAPCPGCPPVNRAAAARTGS